AGLGQVRTNGNLHESEGRARPETALVSMALCRRSDHGGGDQRTQLSGDRRLRPSACAAAWRTVAACRAVEVRMQVNQIDGTLYLCRSAPERAVGSLAVVRIWLLGERQSAGAASALEPGDRRNYRHRRAATDFAFQRVRRIRRRSVQGFRKRAALGLMRFAL